jgi:type II secretory pathway pseudopilin PulG
MDYQSFQPGGQSQNQAQTSPPLPEIPKSQNLNDRLMPYRWHIAVVGVIIIVVLFGAYSYLKYTNQQNDAKVAKQAEEAQKKIDEIIQKRAQDMTAGQFCGGIAGIQCPSEYTCRLDGSYPDAGGRCIKNAIACTEEAKQCPDGSYVGRTGPNCEFTACPK